MKRVMISFPWPLSAAATRELLSFMFATALLMYLALYLAESLWFGAVSQYYNLESFLWAAIVSGVFSSLWPVVASEANPKTRPGWKDYLRMLALAVVGGMIVFYKTQTLGWVAKVIALLSALIILGMSLLVYFDQPGDGVNEHPGKL